MKLLKIIWHELVNDIHYTVAILSLIVVKPLFIVNAAFVPIYVTNVYKTMGKADARKQAEEDLAIYSLIGTIVGFFVGFICGILADKIKLYKLMLFIYSFLILAGSLMLIDMTANKSQKIGNMFWAGNVLAQVL